MFLPTETASLVLEGDLLPSFTAVTGKRKGVRTYIPCSTSALPTQGAACDAWRHCCLSTKCRGQRCFPTPYSAQDEPHKDPGRNSSNTRLRNCKIPPPPMLPCATASDLPWNPPGFQQHTQRSDTLASVPSSPSTCSSLWECFSHLSSPALAAQTFLWHIFLASGG